ncbi:MAG TPA: hypothetical protein VIV15_13510 [Anaerolineales bacterium]
MNCPACSLLLGVMMLAFSSCSAVPDSLTQAPQPSTAIPPSATPTIVWFPPSETPTAQALPTQGPTPERKPGVGRVLLADDFSSRDAWNPGVSEEASIEISGNRMTFAAQPGITAFRVRKEPVLTSFYAEVTARPSLCRNGDEYGLLFRAPTSVAYYSYAVSCNGASYVARVRFGRPVVLHAAVPSADAPVGAPGEVRLGVWVSGPDMRFFLNGNYQFGASDPTYKLGAVGLFARSAGDTPVTVSFSDLSIYSVSYTAPSATPTP